MKDWKYEIFGMWYMHDKELWIFLDETRPPAHLNMDFKCLHYSCTQGIHLFTPLDALLCINNQNDYSLQIMSYNLMLDSFGTKATAPHWHIHWTWITYPIDPWEMRCGQDFKNPILKLIIQNTILSAHCEIASRWMPGTLLMIINIGSLVQHWCHHATSHCLNQCCPRFRLPLWGHQATMSTSTNICCLWLFTNNSCLETNV